MDEKELRKYRSQSEKWRTFAAIWAAFMSTVAAVKLILFG